MLITPRFPPLTSVGAEEDREREEEASNIYDAGLI